MTLLMEPFSTMFDFPRHRLLAGNGAARAFVPAADLVVTDEDVTVVMDVPGLTEEDLEIELVGDVLTVRGERAYPYATDGKGRAWQRLERGFGSFERILQVPEGLDQEAIVASISNGVLSIVIPKPEARKPRRIQITTGGEKPAIEGKEAEQREPAGAAA